MEPTKPGGGAKPSKVEAIKLASQYLKTYVADEVGNGSSHFTEDAATILKFHGSYQQDDRDVRTQLKKEGKEKALPVHGAGPDRRRPADAPTSTWPATTWPGPSATARCGSRPGRSSSSTAS